MRTIDSRCQGQRMCGLFAGMVALVMVALPAAAQDATWLANAGSGDFNNAANWTPGTVPTGTATFGASSKTALTFSSNNTEVGGWTFNATASTYTFNLNTGLQFTGAGIVVNGGRATITNNGSLSFAGNSSAGSATIINNVSGGSNGLQFLDNSSAGSANITNNNGGNITFFSGTAGSATITNNNGALSFSGNSTAGNATITNANIVDFDTSSSGGTARFITQTGGTFDISGLTNGGTTAGSIEGAGLYFLGGNSLTVGSNNLSTEVSGVISDGGGNGGAGGSLVKVGTGTLTLSGANTYTGATTVNGGTLETGRLRRQTSPA